MHRLRISFFIRENKSPNQTHTIPSKFPSIRNKPDIEYLRDCLEHSLTVMYYMYIRVAQFLEILEITYSQAFIVFGYDQELL